MLRSYEIILQKARSRGNVRFVVAGAHGEAILKAAIQSRQEGMMEPILIGDPRSIHQISETHNLSLESIQIIDEHEDSAIAHQAASMLRDGKAQALMKGNISTPVLLKAVLDANNRLRTDRVLSHIALMEVPSYHKLLLITDGGVVIRPNLNQKIDILRNAIEVLNKLGVDPVKAVILSANEKVNPDLPETVDAVKLVEMGRKGEFGSSIIEGPMALDMAFSEEASRIKNVQSRVAGDPDILLVPDVSCGNILAKGLVHLAEARISGVVVGAKIPIALISRAERQETWRLSIALANLLA
ncbi:bifunctional enoyl-CoA hydratase/phosphate acetyltransferase [bacterium]|nr:bifunctional enoyl-CoA hydratase/phosphate acetyltransferase [bacterium]